MQTDTQTSPEICAEQLLAQGWRECPNQFKRHSRCFYKRFDTPTRCHGNYDKPGMQIELALSEYGGLASMEIELCAGLKDGSWVALHNYGLPKNLDGVLALIPRLLKIWEAANEA